MARTKYRAAKWSPAAIELEVCRRAEICRTLAVDSEAQRDEWARCAEDVRHWLGNWAWIENKKQLGGSTKKVPLLLWPKQVELIDRLEAHYRGSLDLLVCKGRELGVTYCCLLWSVHHWLFEPGFAAKLGSVKMEKAAGRSADSLTEKVRRAIRWLPLWMQPPGWEQESALALVINPANGAEILADSTSGSFVQGGRGGAIFLDEAANIDSSLQSSMAEAMESVARMLCRVSTPRDVGDQFHTDYELWPERQKLTLDWRTDPRRSEDFLDSTLKRNGGMLTESARDRQHRCRFVPLAGSVILSIPESSKYRVDPPCGRGADVGIVAGMDFGSGPSLTVAVLFVVDWASGTLYMDRCLNWSRVKGESIARELHAAATGTYGRPIVVCPDPTGRAKGVDQISWHDRIAEGGARLMVPPDSINDVDSKQAYLEEMQEELDDGRLMINEDESILLRALQRAGWDLPKGADISMVARATIGVRKDESSHFLEAALYGWHGARYRLKRPKSDTLRKRIPVKKSIGARLSAATGRNAA